LHHHESLRQGNGAVRAPFTGMVVGITNYPMVSPGSPICHLVKLDKTLSTVENALRREKAMQMQTVPVVPSQPVPVPAQASSAQSAALKAPHLGAPGPAASETAMQPPARPETQPEPVRLWSWRRIPPRMMPRRRKGKNCRTPTLPALRKTGQRPRSITRNTTRMRSRRRRNREPAVGNRQTGRQSAVGSPTFRPECRLPTPVPNAVCLLPSPICQAVRELAVGNWELGWELGDGSWAERLLTGVAIFSSRLPTAICHPICLLPSPICRYTNIKQPIYSIKPIESRQRTAGQSSIWRVIGMPYQFRGRYFDQFEPGDEFETARGR